jgi:nucleotide-binding universal stress UspA family protein
MRYRILVGVDGSEHSKAALRWAVAEAEQRSGEVIALLSWQMPFLSFPGAFDRDEMEKAAKEFLLGIVNEVAPSSAVRVRSVVAEGEPTESLTVAAQDADLLVVGTRGRTRFAGLLLGAVSQGVAATAPCPVVLVKREGVT